MELGTKYKMIRYAEDKNISEFAEICSLSIQNYGEIERCEKAPSPKSIEKINQAVTKLGWEILDDGVVKREKTFLTFEGDYQFHELFNDIDRLLDTGEELLIDGAVENKTPNDILSKVIGLRTKGVKMRHLICEGDNQLKAPLDEYRCIPTQSFVNQSVFLYKNTVAIHSIEENKIIVLRDKNFHTFLRKRFETSWKQYQQPTHTEETNVFTV